MIFIGANRYFNSIIILPAHLGPRKGKGPCYAGNKLQTGRACEYNYGMSWLHGFLLILVIFACIFAAGCGGHAGISNSNAAPGQAENTNTAKTNVEELSMLINVPYEVEDIVWKEDAAHKHLTAVLRLSTQDADKAIAEAATHGTPQHIAVPSESWFPAELVAQSDLSGDDTLRGTAYAADAFFQEPYTSGRLVRVDDSDYLILELNRR
jgi:hypothetical protein